MQARPNPEHPIARAISFFDPKPTLSAVVVAVGTRVSPRAPRTEPYVRLSRIRLPPRVCDGVAIAGPGMEDGRFREPSIRQLCHSFPGGAILLAATPQRAPPEVADMVPKDVQGTTVGRHCVVVEVAADYLAKPFPLGGDRQVHAPSQYVLDLPQLRPHAVRPGLPFDLECAGAGVAADEGEAQEVEGLRLAEPAPLPAFRRKASELDQPGLLRVQRQRRPPQPLAHFIQEAPSLMLVLEADDEVVGISHDDHVARELAPSMHGPEVEG